MSYRQYFNNNTGEYTTEFPNKRNRIVYLMLHNGLTLREAQAIHQVLKDHINNQVVKDVKRGLRPIKKALEKLDKAIYCSQRY